MEQHGHARKIGPSAFMVPVSLMFNPFVWMASLWIAFYGSYAVRELLWHALKSFPIARKAELAAYTFGERIGGAWLGLGVLILIAVFTVIRFLTTEYLIDGDSISIRCGYLNLRGPKGPFVNYCDTIAFAQIVDPDPFQTIPQSLCGTGSMRILKMSGEKVVVSFVPRVMEVRNLLKKNSPLQKANVVGYMRMDQQAG